uniref:3-hydroxyisobutyryl-CoA hydrolase n=1 Tax=Chromera velia CCMP2878 TaxID=1169474 RepID=A0A0G4H100_9ALVE|mmetsp:Transcript_28331/g.55470  ORF Transcript_28331/g.55470 Transcript_28331/m.55470 type:complete len:573 (-) Transcript_28331:188-1906(-)|eukprot:Cvel_24219.t1-p1 / transcript=Cvel_24219.t1 / gene=Cvel_24219 / organism=Chromera_velia_CCMP2878 / gene_product=Probable 3-hydroxyisobutyryl-CoA hydrolase 3, putative / transcript_product=Probable 3-hydroxyisobutyryl-CoA hydrolase 3, putative / location=Cvel_scaffold2589:11469-19188(+) / protein_length=572 / sequence_SO=supercontig / SO=protein_coding / is_pseudo=false
MQSSARRSSSCLPVLARLLPGAHGHTATLGLVHPLPANFLLQSVRRIRTGFFRDDRDFIDPESVLFAPSVEEWQHADDPTLSSPVLERNNVGMGILLLNREKGIDLTTCNLLFRKLRELEVNSMKKFVVLSSIWRDVFCAGVDKKELLELAEASQWNGTTLPIAFSFLKNRYETSWLIATYEKPLLALMNGSAQDAGALSTFANISCAYRHSEYKADSAKIGFIPDGGASLLLGLMPAHLGSYVSLTGKTIRGPDLITTGLARQWVSPEALPFLEITSEKQLEVSEQDGKALLEEHFLTPPEAGWEFDVALQQNVRGAFSQPTLPAVVRRLEIQAETRGHTGSWARQTLTALRDPSRSPLALCVTFELLRRVRARVIDLLVKARIGAEEWERLQRGLRTLPTDHEEASERQIVEGLRENVLEYALRAELRVASRLMMKRDLVEGLRSHLTGGCDEALFLRPQWTYQSIEDVPQEEVDSLFEPLEFPTDEFAVCERSGISLSAHPRLRRMHPDFDPETGLDHDPLFMRQEDYRWSPQYLREEKERLHFLLHSPESPHLRKRAEEAARAAGIFR